MFRKYRELSAATKLVSFGVLTALFFALQTKMGDFATASINTGMFAAVVVAFHTIATYPRFVKLAVVALTQLVVLTFTASAYSFFYITEDPQSSVTIFLTTYALLFTTSLISLYAAVLYSKGKVWLNLLVSYLLIDFAGLFIGLATGLPYLVALIISAVAGVVFIGVRSRVWKQKTVSPAVSETRKEIYNTHMINSKIEKLIKKEGWTAVKPEGYENFWVVNTGKQVLLLTGIYFADNIVKTSKGLMYRNIPVENILGEVSEIATVISQEHKLPRNKTHFAVVDVNNKFSLPAVGFQTFGLSANAEKTRISARILLSNVYGLASFVGKTKNEEVDNVWANFQKSVKA